MISLLADENLDGRLVRGLRRHFPKLPVLRLQDTPAKGEPDEVVLAYAASIDCVLLTHDLATIPRYAWNRVAAGEKMPGVIAVAAGGPPGLTIQEIALYAECLEPGEIADRVLHLALP